MVQSFYYHVCPKNGEMCPSGGKQKKKKTWPCRELTPDLLQKYAIMYISSSYICPRLLLDCQFIPVYRDMTINLHLI